MTEPSVPSSSSSSICVASTQLSNVVAYTSSRSPDTLRCNFREIQIIDLVPAPLNSVLVLDLSHNSLQSLEGIQQFKGLKTLVLDYNLLDDVAELGKVRKKEGLAVLSVVGNPMSLHPDLTPTVLRLCPKYPPYRLREVNGLKVTESTFQEIELGDSLAQALVPYFYRNERMLIALDQVVKRTKIAVELIQEIGDLAELPGVMRRKLGEIPLFPELNFQTPTIVRPSTILAYISMIETQLQPLFPILPDEYPFEITKIVHFIYRDLILRLHGAGCFELQRYLQRRYYSAPTLEDEYLVEFREFLLLGNADNQTENEEVSFPVFSCNSEYLKSVFAILESQINAFESLHRDYIGLLETYNTQDSSNNPEPDLAIPHCESPPLLPSFLLENHSFHEADSDLEKEDEYTFRNRELREMLRTARNKQEFAEEFREKTVKKHSFEKWKSTVSVQIRHKVAVAESTYHQSVARRVFTLWKTRKSEETAKSAVFDEGKTVLEIEFRPPSTKYQRKSDQNQSRLGPDVREFDLLLEKLKTAEQKFVSEIAKHKRLGTHRNPPPKKSENRPKSSLRKAAELHWVLKDMKARPKT